MFDYILKKQLKKFPWAIRLVRWYNTKTKYFDWQSILSKNKDEWENIRAAARGGRKVLMGTCVGGLIASTNMESMLAVALTLRGGDVQFLLCDGILKACMACEFQLHGQNPSTSKPLSQSTCGICHKPAFRHLDPLGLRVNGLREYLSDSDLAKADRLSSTLPLDKIQNYCLDGISVGEQAYAGALRFVARGDFEAEPRKETILRQYLHASIVAYYAIQRFITQHRPEVAVFNHGIYVPQGILGEVCRKFGVEVVNWNPAYRKNCFIFSHEDTYHHTMITEPQSNWRDIAWNKQKDDRLMTYLNSRWDASNDWIWFHEKPNTDLGKMSSEIGIDFDRPTIGLLTSVVWDAALHYSSNAFPSMIEWLFDTIDYFQKRQDLQLLIRIHPAEIQGGLPSRQRIADEISQRFPTLLDNIYIIPANSDFSTYAMMLQCNSTLIYNTKTGIELAAYGMPVVVAGEAWVRNKGFTFDANDPHKYHQILDQLPFSNKLSEDQLLMAKKYAYHFFFRRMIPLRFTAKSNGTAQYRLTLRQMSELSSGACKGLDTICDGTLNGSDFIYKE